MPLNLIAFLVKQDNSKILHSRTGNIRATLSKADVGNRNSSPETAKELFLLRNVQVSCVNLLAHLVIIMGTEFFNGKLNR